MNQCDWPILKKIEIVKPPQNRIFYGKMECLPFQPTYIGEKGRPLGKTYGIKARCYWEHPWGTSKEPKEYIENVIGTHWELEKEHVRNKEKMKKILHSTPRLAFVHQTFL
jgi:hypothetical protein